MGTTIIDKEGNFTFELNAPVISGHSIGLQLGDITNTEFNEADFYYNDSYYDRPIVGTLFDMVTVK